MTWSLKVVAPWLALAAALIVDVGAKSEAAAPRSARQAPERSQEVLRAPKPSLPTSGPGGPSRAELRPRAPAERFERGASGVGTTGAAAKRLRRLLAGEIPPECRDAVAFVKRGGLGKSNEEPTSQNITGYRIASSLVLAARVARPEVTAAALGLLDEWLAKSEGTWQQGEQGSSMYTTHVVYALHVALDSGVLTPELRARVLAELGRVRWWVETLDGWTVGNRSEGGFLTEIVAWRSGEHPKLAKWLADPLARGRVAWAETRSWRAWQQDASLWPPAVPPRLRDPVVIVLGSAGGHAAMPKESAAWDNPGTAHVVAWRGDRFRWVNREPHRGKRAGGERRYHEVSGERQPQRLVEQGDRIIDPAHLIRRWEIGAVQRVVLVDRDGARELPPGTREIPSRHWNEPPVVVYRSPTGQEITLRSPGEASHRSRPHR